MRWWWVARGMGGEKKLVGWLGSGKREEREKKNK